MKNALILLLLAFGIFYFLISPFGQRAFWSVLVVSELLNIESQGWIGRWSNHPQVTEVSFQGVGGMTKADLYLPPSGKSRPGILLNHGVVDTGKDDPRLKRFAEILCRAGFIVFVPEFQGMKSFRVSPMDVNEIQAAYEFFWESNQKSLNSSCGLFAFSYGAGPTLIAAAQPPLREKVKFLVSFGGYYDLKNVLSFIATGHCEFKEKKYFRNPQQYGKWVFLASNLDWVRSSQDREILKDIVQKKLRDERAPVGSLVARLGPEGKNILTLLSHPDPAQTEQLIREMPAEFRRIMEDLFVGTAIQSVKADLILAHGEDDDLIPFTETLRLAENAPDPRKVYMQILKSYSHVDPEKRTMNLKNFFTHHLPETWKLFGLVNQLMKHREG